MARARVRTLTTREFRGMDSLSGELRVAGGSRRRRGVRRPRRAASCLPEEAGKSPEVLAGTDGTCRVAADGSAHTSTAHVASCATTAEPAEPRASGRRRPPVPKGMNIRLRFTDETEKPASGGKPIVDPCAARNPDAEPASKSDLPPETTKNEPKTNSCGGGEGKGKPIESLWEERVHLDGGDDLPSDGPGFVDAVNEYVDLVRLTDSLLRERDEKSSKNLLEKLLEMKYGKTSKAEPGGARSIASDLPGPVRD